MRNDIINQIDNPRELEKLYRENKSVFRKEFNAIYPDIKEHKGAEFWKERLSFETGEISWGTSGELTLVIIAALIAGQIAKLPDSLGLNEEVFYPRNISFIMFPLLTFYFGWKNKMATLKAVGVAFITLLCVIYINLLPDIEKSDTSILACIHLPLFLWALLGITFTGDKLFSSQKRLDFLRYNGDLVVLTTLILISGMLLTGITIGLFSLIKINIEKFYFEYIVIYGLAAAPIIGTFIVQTNPQLVNKVSPLIAKLFTPLVLITLVTYLIAIIISGKDPYNDREFLMIFNGLLIGVMAIILFSVAENSGTNKSRFSNTMLFLLSSTTIIVNAIALSAIIFRISEWGITPNRIAVLGGNILILTNLLVVTYRLFKTIRKPDEINTVEDSIATFLPVYSLWTIIVTFLFPLLFGFK